MSSDDTLVTGEFGSIERYSSTQMMIDALPNLKNASTAALVYIDDEGRINTVWSAGKLTTRLGMLDIAKRRMIDLSLEEE